MEPDPLDLLARAAVSTEAVLAGVGSASASRPTPCPTMNVLDVATHLIGGIEGFTEVARGGALSFAGDPVLDVGAVRESFASAVADLLDAFGEPGRVEASYAMPWGTTTGAQLLGFELIEIVVHGWDIARGLNTVLASDDSVVEATLTGAPQWIDDSVRVPGMFGAEICTDRDGPLDRLVAFLGREPGWAP